MGLTITSAGFLGAGLCSGRKSRLLRQVTHRPALACELKNQLSTGDGVVGARRESILLGDPSKSFFNSVDLST